MVRALFLSVCLLAMVGCGSTRPQTSDCEDYVENFLCPAVVNDCSQYSNYTSFGDCVSYFESVYYGCSTTQEAPGLGGCEADTDAYSCAELFTPVDYSVNPPLSCSGVFFH